MTEPTRVHVLLPESEAQRFEAYCKVKGHKKSTLIVRLIRDHLDRERFDTQRKIAGAERAGGRR